MQPSTTIRYIRVFFCKLKQRIIPRPHLFCPKMLCYAWTEKLIKILEMAAKCLSLFLAGFSSPFQVFPISPPNAWSHQAETFWLCRHIYCSDFGKKKNISGNVSSGHQNRSRDQTSRVLLLKFEVVLKPNRFLINFKLSEFYKCT